MKSGKTRNAARLVVILIALLLFGGLLGSAPQAAQPWKVSSVDLVGVDGSNNNLAFVDDRYILVAPYAPSKVPTDAAAVDQLNNYYVSLVDSKRPADGVLSHPLETASDHERLYYPTKLVYDPATRTVYVRGTRYEPVDGGVQEVAVIAYTHLYDDGGKPVFDDNVVMIDIAGVGNDKTASDAPDDLVLANNGSLLVFTNGASIFTYNLDHGYLYKVDIVEPKAYDAGSRITYLDVDAATGALTVYWNRQVSEAGKTSNHTELSFYKLEGNGTMNLVKRINPEDFPNGVYITPGSNIELSVKFDDKGLFTSDSYALVVGSDGALWQLDFSPQGRVAALKSLYQFDAMAASGADSSPRMLKFDAAKRLVGIVKQGFTAQIRKPSNDRRSKAGSVIRSLSLFEAVESPALAVARFNKNLSKVVASKMFADEFRDEAGLTRLVDGRDSQWMLATRSGRVLTLNPADAADAMSLGLLAEVGARTGRVTYFGSRDSIVAINSFDLDAANDQIRESGALVVARPSGPMAQSFGVASAATLLSKRMAKAQGPTPSIRRPCNLNKQ